MLRSLDTLIGAILYSILQCARTQNTLAFVLHGQKEVVGNPFLQHGICESKIMGRYIYHTVEPLRPVSITVPLSSPSQGVQEAT